MANTIQVNVVADVKNLNSGIAQVNNTLGGFGKSVGRITSGLKNMAIAGVGFAAGGAIGGLIKGTVQAASDAQQSIGATETVFGKFANTVISKSGEAAAAYGISANEYRNNANIIGSLFKNQGVAAGELADKTDLLISRGADLSATFGGSATDAVNALASAYKGEFDPLERYGISIKQSSINTLLAAKGQDKLTGAAMAAAKQQATTELIMRQSAASTGAFGKESDTLAHQQQVLGAKFEDVKAKLGTALLPILTTVTAFIADKVIPAFSNFHMDQLGESFKGVLPAVQQFGNFLRDTALPAVMSFGVFLRDNVVPIVVSLGEFMLTKVVPAAAALATTLASVLMPPLQAITGFFAEHKLAVEAAVVALTALFVITKAHAAFLAVEAAGGLVAYIAQMNIVQTATKVWTAMQWLLNAAMSANPIGIVVVAIAALVAAFVIAWKNSETFRNIVIGAWEAIKTATSAVWNFLKDLTSTVWNAIKTAVSTVVEVIKTVVTTYFNVYKTIITTAWNVIKTVTETVWNAIKTAVSAVTGWIRGAATAVFNGFESAVTGVWNAIKTATTTAWNGMKTAVSTALSAIVQYVKDFPGNVVKGFSTIGTLLVSAGKDMMRGFLNGIKSMAGDIKDAALAPVKDAVGAVKGFLHIGSPSKLFYQFGKWTNEGLANGLKETYGVRIAASGMAKAVAAGFEAPKLALSAPDLSGMNSNTSGFGGGTVINVEVTAPVGSNAADIGREIDQYLAKYEAFGGRRLST